MSILSLAHSFLAASVNVAGDGTVTANGGFVGGSVESVFKDIANVLIYITGAVSVIMVIVGGLRYVLSSGNSKAVEDAKNTILYAIVGVIVAAAAFAIVNFVIGKF